MPADDRPDLEEFVRLKLWSDWDPIGVNQHSEAFGEYDSYVGTIVGLLRRRVGVQQLFEHLRQIECHHMGISESPQRLQRTMEFARQLLEATAPLKP